ncbi:MAG: thiamine pyrophosphate-binding protein [Pseudomonadota bacterium]
MTRVADIAAETLHAHGVRRAFGMPGGEVVTFIDALEKVGIRFVLARHETAAAFMAAAEGVNRDAPGLLVTTVGPGLSNAINGIADASQEHVPLIIVSGVVDHDIRHRYTHQVLDQAALLRPLVKATFEVEAEGVGATVARAARLALQPPMGPVHIDLAPGTAAKPAAARDAAVAPFRDSAVEISPESEAIRALEKSLSASERPLIIAGLGAVDGHAHEALVTLSERLGAPVITTYKAKGVIPESHPLSLGGAGLSPKADPVLLEIVRASDVVLLVGYDPIEMRPGWFDPFAETAHVIDMTAYPSDHGMHVVSDQLVGPVDALLRAVVAGLKDLGTKPRWSGGEIPRARQQLEAAFASSDNWGPHGAIEVLQSKLDAKTVVTVDSGAHRILLSQKLKAGHPRQIQQSAGYCTMGTALPSAIGVKIGAPDRHVIAVLGDGGLEMGLGELATLRDTGTNIAIIVFQDESLALIELKQAQAGLACNGVRLGATRFEEIARTYGGLGFRVESADAFGAALDEARAADTFSLIVCSLEAKSYVDSI